MTTAKFLTSLILDVKLKKKSSIATKIFSFYIQDFRCIDDFFQMCKYKIIDVSNSANDLLLHMTTTYAKLFCLKLITFNGKFVIQR